MNQIRNWIFYKNNEFIGFDDQGRCFYTKIEYKKIKFMKPYELLGSRDSVEGQYELYRNILRIHFPNILFEGKSKDFNQIVILDSIKNKEFLSTCTRIELRLLRNDNTQIEFWKVWGAEAENLETVGIFLSFLDNHTTHLAVKLGGSVMGAAIISILFGFENSNYIGGLMVLIIVVWYAIEFAIFIERK